MPRRHKRKNPDVSAVLDELDKHGLQGEVTPTRGGHQKIQFKLNGCVKTIFCSTSPSDWRASKNLRSLVRRTVRQARVNKKNAA